MGIEYLNRRGERYYLLQGKTKTGKPKYYVSRKPDGVPVDQIPEGFELHENPERGLVSVRKTRPSLILPEERATIEQLIRELAGMEYLRVDIQQESLVVYTPSRDPAAAASILTKLFGGFGEESSHREWIGNRATYLPMFRFTLADPEKRLLCRRALVFSRSHRRLVRSPGNEAARGPGTQVPSSFEQGIVL